MVRKSIIESIQDDHPSYDPLAIACEATGISRETARAAADRVYHDGYSGPINPADWREQDGREPSRVDDALAILKQLADAIPDYRAIEYIYCGCDDCEECGPDGALGHENEETVAEAHEIADALFPFVREIYGRGIASL